MTKNYKVTNLPYFQTAACSGIGASKLDLNCCSPPRSCILEWSPHSQQSWILLKTDPRIKWKNLRMKHNQEYSCISDRKTFKVSALQIHTLLENRSLLSKYEQRNIISTALLEVTNSSAWIVSTPKFLKLVCPLLLWRFRVKLRLCFVTICHVKERGSRDIDVHHMVGK